MPAYLAEVPGAEAGFLECSSRLTRDGLLLYAARHASLTCLQSANDITLICMFQGKIGSPMLFDAGRATLVPRDCCMVLQVLTAFQKAVMLVHTWCVLYPSLPRCVPHSHKVAVGFNVIDACSWYRVMGCCCRQDPTQRPGDHT